MQNYEKNGITLHETAREKEKTKKYAKLKNIWSIPSDFILELLLEADAVVSLRRRFSPHRIYSCYFSLSGRTPTGHFLSIIPSNVRQ